MKFEVVEAKAFHCGQISRTLRESHRVLVAHFGVDGHRQLRARFEESAFRRAWKIDGHLAAIGGVTGPMLASSGLIWLAVAGEAMRYPVAMVREARKQLDEICVTKRDLYTTIIDGDEESKRFAIFLGFTPDEEGLQPASSKFGRMLLKDRFEASPARMMVGVGFGTLVRFQPAGG